MENEEWRRLNDQKRIENKKWRAEDKKEVKEGKKYISEMWYKITTARTKEKDKKECEIKYKQKNKEWEMGDGGRRKSNTECYDAVCVVSYYYCLNKHGITVKL